MTLALHRSITFWSGLLVMAFVCWAWWDSLAFSSSSQALHCNLINATGALVIEHRGDNSPKVSFERKPIAPQRRPSAFLSATFERGSGRNLGKDLVDYAGGEPSETVGYDHGRALEAIGVFKTPLDRILGSFRYRPPSDWRLCVPHWLIQLAVAALWLGLLFWRARCTKRHVYPAP